MDNQTTMKYFQILAFSSEAEKRPLFSIVFVSMYLIVILGNTILLSVVYVDTQLHTPMYLFLGNLSVVDIGFTTVILPKLMNILLTGNNTMSFIECFTQMYFSIFLGGTEMILLSAMAYDRYVAICHPLHYYINMKKEKCAMILGGTWLSGCLNSLFYTAFASQMVLCHSNKIENFYCDSKALVKIICANTTYHIVTFVETLLFGLFPFLLNLISYIKIVSTILSIKSTESRRKSFSTCTSHLTVLIIFYGSIMCVYMRSSSDHTLIMDQIFSMIYAAVTPMLNPLIYSLRNKEVKGALRKVLAMRKR